MLWMKLLNKAFISWYSVTIETIAFGHAKLQILENKKNVFPLHIVLYLFKFSYTAQKFWNPELPKKSQLGVLNIMWLERNPIIKAQTIQYLQDLIY